MDNISYILESTAHYVLVGVANIYRHFAVLCHNLPRIILLYSARVVGTGTIVERQELCCRCLSRCCCNAVVTTLVRA